MLKYIDILEKNIVDGNEYKNEKKSEIEKFEILVKLKSLNLPKYKFKHLFKSKNIQSTSNIK